MSALLSWSVSYVLWLSQGCMPFLPCVSDLAGGDSGPIFMWGMTLAAALLIPTWFDYYYAIKAYLNPVDCHWGILCKFMLLLGVYSSFCIMGVALNPWSERIILHLLSAGGLFVGGGIFLFIDACLAYARGKPFGRVLCITLVAFSALILMCLFIVIGFAELSNSGGAIDMSMMRTDFKGYCMGKAGSLHANWNFSVAALGEWMMIILGATTCCFRLHTELRMWKGTSSSAAVDDDATAALADVS